MVIESRGQPPILTRLTLDFHYVYQKNDVVPITIEDLCQNMTQGKGLSIDFIAFGDEQVLNDIMKITVYRITQELLKNIIKHAEANEVIVQLTIEKDQLLLIVEDDGKGFNPKDIQGSGIGIKNIRSRTEFLDGHLDIYSIPDKGTSFTVELPLNTDKP